MTTVPAIDRRTPAALLRFDRVQRAAHWANAVLFGVLMLTALPLYFGSLAGIVVQRHLAAEVHLWAGIFLPVPVIVSLLGPWGGQMRRDVRRINLWTRAEIRWLRTLGKTPLEADKFNPGQKLNAIFVGGVIVVMLVTGSILQWFRFFAFLVFVVVFGHIAVALTHRDSMRSMIRGWVTERWAAQHAPSWLKEHKTVSIPPGKKFDGKDMDGEDMDGNLNYR
jgi:formate dehydrogenase subunit gamma